MQLGDLLRECPGAELTSGSADLTIRGVTQDSRRVREGSVFVAIAGLEHDGHEFIPAAISAGAAAIVSERSLNLPAPVAYVRVPAARAALADLAAAYWGHPSDRLTLIGVTGTDGKTSTTQLIGAILAAGGRSVGWLTTEGIRIGNEYRANALDHTTPEAPEVQAVLAEMVAAGVETAVLEVSSHALALDRVRGCRFDVGVFTNLSPEHINFHGSLEAYREAKSRLFGTLSVRAHRSPFAVINRDDPSWEVMAAACRVPVHTYGMNDQAEYTACDVQLSVQGSRFLARTPLGDIAVATHLLGAFNVVNWLAAIAVSSELGVGAESIQRAAHSLSPVRGRMERINGDHPFLVVVDFAHTPQALETALRTLRPHTDGRLMALFGQAGGRDPANRPAMGALAMRLSDYFLITLDDPIFEDPEAIALAIAGGAERAGAVRGRDFDIELDRRAAIERLVRRARPGDTILLAGKGHEQRMLVGNQKLPWDDASEARAAIQRAGQ